MPTGCPDRKVLKDYLLARGSPSDTDGIESHIGECEACQSQLTRLSRPGDPLVHILRQSVQSDEMENEPELVRALGAIHEYEVPTHPDRRQDIDADRIPSAVREYRIVRQLGEGGMGTVFLAHHTRLDRPVALKILRWHRMHDQQSISRFEREMRAIGKLEHPNIVHAFDAGEENGVHFLAMEFVEGVDLSQLVRRLGKLAVADACEIVRQAALGLSHAHQNQLVHRDVKPSNLMLSSEGDVKLLDLGLARLNPLNDTQELTRHSQVIGTILYMAPEQADGGRVGPLCDIYGLGVTFHELLAGGLPPSRGFGRPDLPDIGPLRNDIPDVVLALLRSMTAALPDDRPESMSVVADLLEPWTKSSHVAALARGCVSPLSSDGDVSPLPPPVTRAWGETTSVSQSFPAPPSRSSIRRIDHMKRNTIYAVLTLVGFVLSITGMSYFGASHGKKYELPADRNGTDLKTPAPSSVTVEVDGGIFESLLQRHMVRATERSTGQELTLKGGTNQLLPGEYAVEVHPPDLQLRLSESKLSVGPGDDLSFSPTVQFRNPWRYPTIPDQAGAFAEYTGTLDFSMGSVKRHVALGVRLYVLGADADDEGTWILIEIHNQDKALTECGYLLIDRAIWLAEHRLEIKRGWLVASGSQVSASLLSSDDDGPLDKLVARFDKQVDTLGRIAARRDVDLPADRFSVHELLVLLFGLDDLPPAPETSRRLRALLASADDPRLRIDVVPLGPFGNVTCVLVDLGTDAPDGTGGDQPSFSYGLARNDSMNFGFVRVHATWSDPNHNARFEGSLRMTNQGSTSKALPPEEEFRSWAAELKAPAESSRPFDLAAFPEEVGAEVVYKGMFTQPPRRKLWYEAAVRSGGAEMIDGVPHRWIELSVESGLEGTVQGYREAAKILVNGEKLAEREFEIHRGWIESRREVFAFDVRGNIDEMEGGLLILGKRLPPDRFKVHDVLSLMFDARLEASARFASIRHSISSSFVDAGLDRVSTRQEISLPFDPNRKVYGEQWMPPKNERLGFDYLIRRSRQLPFDIHSVKLSIPTVIALTAALHSVRERGADGILPDEATLRVQAKKTNNDITRRQEKRFNFRVWKVVPPNGERELHWAEYAGPVPESDKVALRFEDEKLVFVLPSQLDQDSRDAIELGRIWTWRDSTGVHRTRGRYVGQIRGVVRLKIRDGVTVEKIPFTSLSPRDQQWIRDRPG